MIGTIPPKKVEKFTDPFKYDPNKGEETEVVPPAAEPTQDEESAFKYLLGESHYKDMNGGDAGCVEKKSQYHPFIHFVRSQYCGKYQNSILHADVATVGGSNKMMKEYNITTGFIIAYKNTFDVDIYNIQRPSKDACPENYS